MTINDAQGCEITTSYTVGEPATLVVAETMVDATCAGFADGTITLEVTGGTLPYTYTWSNEATTASITDLTAGTYAVTINDAQGCEITTSYTVGEPATLVVTETVVDATCAGFADGTITLEVTGGTLPYTYTWSNEATTATIADLTAGTYAVTINDAQGCEITASYTVGEPATLVVAETMVDATCAGFADGTITLEVTGGTLPYTYTWSNEATTASISDLTAGTYAVTINDAQGCEITSELHGRRTGYFSRCRNGCGCHLCGFCGWRHYLGSDGWYATLYLYLVK